jgi:hypothetical protein
MIRADAEPYEPPKIERREAVGDPLIGRVGSALVTG